MGYMLFVSVCAAWNFIHQQSRLAHKPPAAGIAWAATAAFEEVGAV